MKNFLKTKAKNKRHRGIALQEYVLIAALFAVACAAIGLYMNPSLLKKYFERSINGTSTTAPNGTLTIPAMGE